MDIEVANGMIFRARVAGSPDATPVLLLHGFPQTSRCWVAQLEALAGADRYAVAFDQRGYSPGARPATVEAYKPAALVADVLAVADAMGFDRFDLVGHDFGGAVAWMVAGHHPDRVVTLAVASTPHPAAFRSSYQEAGSDQNERSGYMRSFREAARGSLEDALVADDARRLRHLYDGLEPDAIDDYVAALADPGALVAALDWYRSMSGRAERGDPGLDGAHPLRVERRRSHHRPRGGRGHRRLGDRALPLRGAGRGRALDPRAGRRDLHPPAARPPGPEPGDPTMSDAPLDPTRTALLLMDVQVGILASLDGAEALVDRLEALTATARAAGLAIGYVRVALTADERAAVPDRNKSFSALAGTDRMTEGTPETAVHPRLAPHPGDLEVRKIRVGALSTTDLAAQLASRGIDTLVLTGVSTSGVVLSTVRAAADADLRLIVIADGVADPDPEVHRVLLEKVLPRQADVLTAAELTARLEP